MAQGLERRDVVQDNLRGAEAIDPVTRAVPSIPTPSAVQAPRSSFNEQIAQSMAKFTSGKLAAVQQKQQAKSMREGQIAAMQGQAFDAVEMEGDKWKLEGYRGVVAQTMTTSLLRAQEQDINSGAYEEDPETYRQTLSNRVDAMTADITDPRTRELAQEQLMQQMPKLIDSHTKQHLAFKEQQNFDSLAQSVDVLSRDPENGAAMVAFATGASEATQGLSESRRKEATVQGVVNAFRNGNPAAYAHLESAGFLNTENLTAQQLNTIEAAKQQYHSRNAKQWNEDHYRRNLSIRERAANGEIDPSAAVAETIRNDAEHGRLTTYQDAGQIYTSARNGVEFAQGTRALNIEAAGLQGDYRTQADLLTSAVEHQESRGNPNAVSPKGATGLMQLMPATAENPGYGLPNIHQVAAQMGEPAGSTQELMRNPRVNKRMGNLYLQKMLEINNGDVELALISYNAGKGRADEYVAAGRNWDNVQGSWKHESRDYVEKITANVRDDRPDPEGARRMAENRVRDAREWAAVEKYEASYPALNEAENLYRTGQITDDEFRARNREVLEAYGIEVDKQFLQQERAITQSIELDNIREAQAAKKAEVDNQSTVDYLTSIAVYDEGMDRLLERAEAGEVPAQAVHDAVQAYGARRRELQQQYGITPTGAQEGAARVDVIKRASAAIRAGHEGNARRIVREQHAARGTASALPPSEQQALIKDLDANLSRKYTDLAAQPGADQSVLGAQMMQERNTQLAQAGIIDPQLKATLNVGLKQPALIDGQPNPALVESVVAYQQLKATNPALADKYIGIENRAVLDSITSRVGGQGNVEAAVKSFGDQYNGSGNRPVTTMEQVASADTLFGSRDRIDMAVTNYLKETDIGIFEGMFSSRTTGTNQAFDRRGFDMEQNRDAVRTALTTEIEQVLRESPWASPSEVVRGATERVSRRYAIIGPQFIDFGGDPYEAMFGNRAEEYRGNTDALNSAFMTYLRSDSFREQYPDSTGSTLGEWLTSPGEAKDTALTGVRPFEVWPVPDGTGGVHMALSYLKKDGSMSVPININPQDVGTAYMRELSNSY